MALFPLPLPASSPSPPPSAGWSLISAGKGQKEGERGTEAGREGGEIKGGKLAGSPTKTRRQKGDEDVDEVGERSGGRATLPSGLATDLSSEQEAFGIVVR